VGRSSDKGSGLLVNRAPVLTLWAAVVAEQLGFERAEALTRGRVVAGLNAYAKGVSLGLFRPTPPEVKEQRRRLRAEDTLTVDLLHRAVPARQTPEGLRALSKECPVDPASVERYLASKFGDRLAEVEEALRTLARSLPVSELAARGYDLYVAFRPEVPPGEKGWGVKGWLDLDRIRELTW
jgi:hypothetical protein